MRAVGDGAWRWLSDVGDASDLVGVMGFMWRPDMMDAAVVAGWVTGERGGIAGRTFSRWACRYALLFCEGIIVNAGDRVGLATRTRVGGEGKRLGLAAPSGVVPEDGTWIGSPIDSPLDSVSPRFNDGLLCSRWSMLRSTRVHLAAASVAGATEKRRPI
jgi:hypothetical protein